MIRPILLCAMLFIAACSSSIKDTSCTLTANNDDSKTISCPDGTTMTIADSQPVKEGTEVCLFN